MDVQLRNVTERVLEIYGKSPRNAARQLQITASQRFGGKFQAIVSACDFAYVHWFDDKSCKLKYRDRHAMVWQAWFQLQFFVFDLIVTLVSCVSFVCVFIYELM